MAHSLNEIIGNNLVSNYTEQNVIGNASQTGIIQVCKTEQQLYSDKASALSKANKLYSEEGKLDLKTYNYLVGMINDTFNYYMEGPKPVEIQSLNNQKK